MMRLAKRPDAVYLLAALLALGAHGAVFALSWQRPPSIKIHVQGAPGVEIRLAAMAASPEPAPAPKTERAPVPEAPAPRPVPKPKAQERPAPQKNKAVPQRQSHAPAAPAPDATSTRATTPEPLGSLDNKQPRYPDLARKRGQQGNVTLLVKVNDQGAVSSITVQNGSGYSLLDKTAADAVKKWRFSPARLNGMAVAGSALVTIEFRLE